MSEFHMSKMCIGFRVRTSPADVNSAAVSVCWMENINETRQESSQVNPSLTLLYTLRVLASRRKVLRELRIDRKDVVYSLGSGPTNSRPLTTTEIRPAFDKSTMHSQCYGLIDRKSMRVLELRSFGRSKRTNFFMRTSNKRESNANSEVNDPVCIVTKEGEAVSVELTEGTQERTLDQPVQYMICITEP